MRRVILAFAGTVTVLVMLLGLTSTFREWSGDTGR